MKANKEDNLKKLIKLAGTDQPTGGFTGMVMNMIEADAAKENALKLLLKQQPAEGPAFNFTAGVMVQISAKPKAIVFQPVITKKAWYAIAGAMCIIFLALIGLSGAPIQHKDNVDTSITLLMQHISAIPAAYAIAAAMVAILFVADYLFTSRTEKTIAS